MKTLQVLALAIALTAAGALTSCGGDEQGGQKTYNYDRADSLPDDYLEQLGIVKTNIEVTGKLFLHMSESGYNFNESYMLSTGKSFSGSSGQAMGIGAMGSDLVYTSSFGQNQSAMSRMKSLMELSGALGISEAFDEKLLEQLASDDSTINKPVLLTKAYLNAKNQLFSEERAQLATFMVVGGWLEGLHIATQMVKADITDQDVRIGYWDICKGHQNVMKMMAVFEGKPEMKSALEQISSLSPALGKIVNNPKKYSAEDVAELESKVEEVRGKLL